MKTMCQYMRTLLACLTLLNYNKKEIKMEICVAHATRLFAQSSRKLGKGYHFMSK